MFSTNSIKKKKNFRKDTEKVEEKISLPKYKTYILNCSKTLFNKYNSN